MHERRLLPPKLFLLCQARDDKHAPDLFGISEIGFSRMAEREWTHLKASIMLRVQGHQLCTPLPASGKAGGGCL